MKYVIVIDDNGDAMFSDNLVLDTLSVSEDGTITIVAKVKKDE